VIFLAFTGSADLGTLPDEELMRMFCRGNQGAFSVLLGRHQGPIFNFAARHVGDHDAAADITQEVFFRVINSRAEYEQRAKFTTWLYTIARNLCVDFLRRRRFRRTESLDRPMGNDPEGVRTGQP
jgi:RNA polymerase sigma-70 factor (ECF subfamily)